MNNYPCRKSHRLKNYNYSSNGSYFITICIKNKECLLGDIIVGVDALIDPIISAKPDNINDLIYQKATNAEMILSSYGEIIKNYIERGKSSYETLTVDNYVIMPNHIHLILSISFEEEMVSKDLQHALIPKYVRTLKTLITKEIGFSMFQRDYYDHIIRDEKEYEKIWNYIDTNVSNWMSDRFYMY